MKCVNGYLGDVLPSNAAAALLIEVDGAAAVTEADSQKVLSICQENHAINAQLAKDSQEAVRLANSRGRPCPL
jgi:hypothetical protein